MEQVKVRINGEDKIYNKGIEYKEIAKEYESQYDCAIMAVFANGKLRELAKTLKKDGEIRFVLANETTGYRTYLRGMTMVLMKAIYEELGKGNEKKVSLEYSIGDGYFCEVNDMKVTEQFVAKIKKRMEDIVKADLPFHKESYDTSRAIELFEELHMEDKAKLFRFRRPSRTNIYFLGEYADYYYGAMPYSTGVLTRFDIKMYEGGIMLLIPAKNSPNQVSELVPSPKLFETFRESNHWGERVEVDCVGALNETISRGDMKKIILIQEALHEKKIAHIAEDIQNMNKKIVMIAGPSSSGKTSFSYRLSVQLSTLGLKPHPIGVDDYFVNREVTPRDANGDYNYECIEAIDTEQFNKDMQALLDGKEVQLPTYNFVTGMREYNKPLMKLGKDEILVIEGIHCLNDKLSYTISNDEKYRIYISALTQLNIDEHNRIPTTDGRLLRRIVRDARTRGASARQTISMWNSVRNGENLNIFPYQEKADAMFNSAMIYELAILKSYAEPLLFSVPKDCEEYFEAKRLLKFLDYFVGVSSELVPNNSLLREFIGGGVLVN